MTFEETLTDYNRCARFYQFAQAQFNAENVEFILLTRQLQGITYVHGLVTFPWTCLFEWQKIEYIYQEFVPHGARRQVNISAAQRSTISRQREKPGLKASSFDEARKEIERMLQFDLWTRHLGAQLAAAPPAAQPVAAQPVIVTVVVPPSAPVLHLANAEAPDPDAHRRPSAPPPILHHQLPPPPNVLVAPPAAPPTPAPDGVRMLHPKPGPHLRNRQQPVAASAVAAPPPLPPLPQRHKMKVKNAYIVQPTASSASAASNSGS